MICSRICNLSDYVGTKVEDNYLNFRRHLDFIDKMDADLQRWHHIQKLVADTLYW